MSQPNSTSRPRKEMDVYTVMLIVSFICLLIGFICVSIEYSRYETWLSWKTDSAKIRVSYVSRTVEPVSYPSAVFKA